MASVPLGQTECDSLRPAGMNFSVMTNLHVMSTHKATLVSGHHSA